MEIIINHQKQHVPENTTLQAIVTDQVGDKQKGVAVAVNDAVIPRSAWGEHFLKLNDDILIIKATQGG